MTNEKNSRIVTVQRALKVFQGYPLSPQQEESFGRLLDKAMELNNPNPVPVEELEGIKEILDNLWDPALTQHLNEANRMS